MQLIMRNEINSLTRMDRNSLCKKGELVSDEDWPIDD